MEFLTLKDKYIPQAKALWNMNFDDGTPGFWDFLLSVIPTEDIYIGVENDRVVTMLMAATELDYKGKKGFYLYSACTHPDYRGRGYMKGLTEYAVKNQAEKGRVFCVLQPATEELFDFWQKLGFDNIISRRNCEIEIKRNIWSGADFDIITANRFRPVREKLADENTVHYTAKSYEKYTAYLYTAGGSTAESENAYAVYFIENGRLIVKELLADSTLYATKILQAIRERTGFETAIVYLPENSTLFLGEGRKEEAYAIRGLSDDVYVNLMFE